MNVHTNVESIPDIEIIQQITNGEKGLFEILIRRNNPFLYKIGRTFGYNPEDTKDLVQETFISAYLNLSKFENRSSLKTWLIKIMLNNCFQKQKKISFKNEIINSNTIYEKSTPMYANRQYADTNKIVTNGELRHVIETALHQIPVEYRMVFSLREIAGLNIAETADSLNITESNVKVRLSRAKSMLRKEIGKMYSPEDIYEFNLKHCAVNSVMNKINALK
ncbi:MAG: sigma-70 family RNA polymerase sigma factor [Ferruginibacter sp.]|nr:sigma-70 family RNA polymerase sigma factor [Chitinophagaceae bacterium]